MSLTVSLDSSNLAAKLARAKVAAESGLKAGVAAAAQMAKLLGMEAPTKTETKLSVDSPVQFYLPHNGRDALPVAG